MKRCGNGCELVAGLTMLLALVGTAPGRSDAQETRAFTIGVDVRDTANAPIAGASVAVVRGLSEILAAAATDDSGRVSLHAVTSSGDLQVVVRKIGFERSDRFFRAGSESISFSIIMRPTVQQLETVRVTAEQSLKRRSYHIDADEIAAHSDQLLDASDILRKLKPDMICGRSCRPLGSTIKAVQTPARACPSLVLLQPRSRCPLVDAGAPSLSTNVWVNGRRILLIATDTMCQIGRRGILAGLLPGSMQVLCEIRPEHIAEMTYLDSTDNTVGLVNSSDALFIVLKPGVAYEPGRPSHVVADSAPTASGMNAPQLAPYRHRVLGVFDRDTGDPVEGAEVTDMISGTRALTTSTGTVSLVFLPEGGSPVRVSKPGYDDLTIAVEISAEHTTPLTLLMSRHHPESKLD